tara:strand:- start:829 stop:1011 length:183 start_codon:yes stop_codon:yes gene_type:complete
MNKTDSRISKSQFNKFRVIQQIGSFNMASPQAKDMVDASMSKEDYFYLLANYRKLDEMYK